MVTDKYRLILKRAVAVLMLLVTITACFPVSAFANEEEAAKHTLVAENEKLRLYMNEDDLSLIIEDKATGRCIESYAEYDDGKTNKTWLGAMRSALVLTMINKSTDTKQADLINDKVTKKIKKTSDGFSAEIYWTKYKFGMTLSVTLNEDGITACVPDSSIKEDGNEYMIGTICVYPYMGTTYLDTKEGYMFIPDGNGALIYLDNKEGKYSSGYSSMVYGKDIGFDESNVSSLLWDKYEIVNKNEQILAPVYGMAHTEDGIAYLAIIEEGDMRVSIEAWPNGASVDYNRVFARFTERKLYTQPTSNNSSSGSFKMTESDRSHSDLRVRFVILTEEKANYCGMAGAYREYLIERNELTVSDTGYNTRIDFLGTERKSWIVGTSAVTMTTTDDIRTIFEELKDNGISDILCVYKGWQKGGLLNVPITSYKADSKIGGTKELTKLIKDYEAEGISIYLYDDALRINPSEQNATFNIVKKVNKRKFEEKTYKDVYEQFMYLTPQRTRLLLSKMIESSNKNGISNYCIAGITDTLFSWNYSGSTYTRYECAENCIKTIEKAAENNSLVMEEPNAYLWKNTDAFLDLPLYTSSYIYEDESVPFISIVLKGVMPVYSEYVNFEANKREFFLKLVETGTYPSFYITKESSSELIYTNSSDIYSSEYEIYKETIIAYAKELKSLWELTEGAFIISHDISRDGITSVGYSNGIKVLINYTKDAKTVNGRRIEAMSYVITEG